MRKSLLVLLAVALTGILAATALAAGRTISVGDNYLVKRGSHTATVAKGTRVTFKWVGNAPHNVRVTKGPAKFASSVKSSGSYSRTMKKRGTYKLICDVHGDTMRGTLKVN
jgi:plastocyanin